MTDRGPEQGIRPRSSGFPRGVHPGGGGSIRGDEDIEVNESNAGVEEERGKHGQGHQNRSRHDRRVASVVVVKVLKLQGRKVPSLATYQMTSAAPAWALYVSFSLVSRATHLPTRCTTVAK